MAAGNTLCAEKQSRLAGKKDQDKYCHFLLTTNKPPVKDLRTFIVLPTNPLGIPLFHTSSADHMLLF